MFTFEALYCQYKTFTFNSKTFKNLTAKDSIEEQPYCLTYADGLALPPPLFLFVFLVWDGSVCRRYV